MSSSDSEDDCYGNIAQKLQTMKNKYKYDKEEITNVLDDSSVSVQTKRIPPASTETFLEPNTSMNSTDNDELTLDAIIANNSKKRMTRSSKTKVPDNKELPTSTRKAGAKRGRGRKAASAKSPSTTPTAKTTRKPRSRGRQAVNHFHYVNPSLPIYNVGNTDEYPDQCDEQPLFTTNKETVVLEEIDPLDDNEELSVKVYWQSTEFFKFSIRKFQKLKQIFDHFAEKENVSHDKLFFTYNDRIINIEDTPDSIDYSIAKFIDGGIINQSVSQITRKDINKKDHVKIKFQYQNVRKPYETVIKWNDKLQLAMLMFAEHIEMPLNRLKFKFDGDTLPGKNTARELEFEGGECIDVEIMS